MFGSVLSSTQSHLEKKLFCTFVQSCKASNNRLEIQIWDLQTSKGMWLWWSLLDCAWKLLDVKF